MELCKSRKTPEIVSLVLNPPVFFGGNVSRGSRQETERTEWLPETQGGGAPLCSLAARRPVRKVTFLQKELLLGSLGQGVRV